MRVSKVVIDINKNNVKEFFEGRKERISKDPLTAVLYQDDNPQLAHDRDQNEKKKILPLLKLSKKDKVLDIACGIGRWAPVMAPNISQYVGIDFSKDFIKYAKEKYKGVENVSFKELDALSISSEALNNQKFEKVIIAGLLLYLNDEEVKEFMRRLKSVIDQNTIIYIREPIAITERLSLDNIWSDQLKQNYSAIYRTRDELLSLLGDVRILKEGDMYKAQLNNRSETKQYFFIIKVHDMSKETKLKNRIKGYTGGVFDILHEGHLNLLRRARAMCDYLVVGIQADEEVVKLKPKPILTTEERVRQMKAIGIADEVIIYYDGTKPDTLKVVKPDIFIHGSDWEDQTDRSEVIKYMEKAGIKKVLLPRTEGMSTSEIIMRIKTKK